MRNPSKQQASQNERNATCDASKSSTSNQTKKKSPGFEWQFLKALYGGYVHWECNYCHAVKSGGAPRIRDHFLGSSSRSMRRCQSANVEVVAMRIKEHYQCKNRNASMVINQHESGMPNALDEEVGVHSKSSSFAALLMLVLLQKMLEKVHHPKVRAFLLLIALDKHLLTRVFEVLY